MTTTYYTSAYLIDETFESVENAALLVEQDRIVAVGSQSQIEKPSGAEHIDFGNAVMTPGFVNAHCHLELTHIAKELENPGNFTDWLYAVRDLRSKSTMEDLSDAVVTGLDYSVAGGVTTLADLTNFRDDIQQFLDYPIRKVYFQEIIGFPKDQAEAVFRLQQKRLQGITPNKLLTIGAAPHSPYAVSPDLFKRLYAFCKQKNMPFHTHLAEHAGEFEFLRDGSGSFSDLLRRFGRFDRTWRGFGNLSPVKYLERLGVLENAMVVHLNYSMDGDNDILLQNNAKVVYCPRSSEYFHHRDHPIESFLDSGLEVALGTDSLASNVSLSMLDDLHFMHKTYPLISQQTIMKMLSVYGAKALNLDHVTGMLKPGLEADVTVIAHEGNAKDAYDTLFAPDSRVIRTIVAGKTVFPIPTRT